MNINISMICILCFITWNNTTLLCSNEYANQFMSAISVINSFSCGNSFTAYWWLIVLSDLDFTIYYENKQHQQYNSFSTKVFFCSISFLFSTQENFYFRNSTSLCILFLNIFSVSSYTSFFAFVSLSFVINSQFT